MNLHEHIAEVLDHVRGMWRYRWWAVGVAWGISLVGSLGVFTVPDVYQASTKVYVDTEGLLKPLMQGLTATSNTMNEVQLVSQAVLTRPNLEEVAHETDLMLRARTPAQVEQLITGLQERIRITGGRDNIFSIQYEDRSREKAREVVAAVLDTFTESAIDNEGDDAQLTERAVEAEIEVHESRLRASERALAAFKQRNLGYMPGENGDDYYNRLQLALGRASASEEELRVLNQRREELQRQIDGEVPVFGMVSSPTSGTGARCRQSAHIAQIETQLSALRTEFTDKHPRVVSLQETIARLNEECRVELAAANAAGLFATSDDKPLETNPVYQNLRIQFSDTELSIVEAQARLNAEKGEVEQLRRDVDKIMQVETELKQLNRDYDVVTARHQELLKRWEDLQAKKRLDPVTDNVQFRRIEPPFALVDPVGPNRPLLLGAVLVFALGAGAGLAFSLNQVNPTFFTREKLRKAAALPVLGSVRMILTPQAAARRRFDRVVWTVGLGMLFAWTVVSVVLARQASGFVQGLLGGVGA